MKPETVLLPVKVAAHAADLPLPRYMTGGAVGLDLRAAVEQEIIIEPGSVEIVPTGLHAAVPEGFELQIRPRSGLAGKHGISLLNSPGTIDADYRGEIQVILINLGRLPFSIRRGDRIAQMVLCAVPRVELISVDELPFTDRGEGGFGHTGAD
ncbi:MAG: dUTP diphosphatase [Bacillota bacterium]